MFIPLMSFSQENNNLKAIDSLIKLASKDIGKSDLLNGISLRSILKEQENIFIYEYDISIEKTADIFKEYQTKEQLIKLDKADEGKPDRVSTLATKHNITYMWRWYYEGINIKEISINPNEWN